MADAAVEGVDLARPAIVRIITILNSQLTVHFPSKVDVTFPQQSAEGYPLTLSGTGAFISSQGDILTADHVVQPPQNQELSSGLYSLAAQDIADYMNTHSLASNGQVNQNDVIQQLTSGQLASTPIYGKPTSDAYLSTDYTDQINAPNFSSLPSQMILHIDRIEKASPPDQQDTAIIHVPLTDTLRVPIGNSANVHDQDQLTIIGFPGNADVSQQPNDLLTSSINQIYVSSLKTNANGAPLIQVSGNVEQGDSGGPALDSQGDIVGIVSFGITSSSGLNGTSFLQASQSAQSMITSLHINTAPGKQQQLWSQAFNDYAASKPGHWTSAQQEFGQLMTSYPTFQAVAQYRNYAQTQSGDTQQSQNNNTSTTSDTTRNTPTSKMPVAWPAIVLTIISLVVVVILASLLFAVALRQKKKPSTGKRKAAENVIVNGTQKTNNTPPIISIAGQFPDQTGNTGSIRAWPCGHLNRPNARFCSICGEPAPPSTSEA
ncbi:MAG TPA: trypsin-like peptidase domain-containing protein [Dictyobacter sp.]|nr:trypsin-like peptidase domain-containing protein [Dictyobacter sp.]